MKFLISNDDGIHAPGLQALYQALCVVGEVIVVAPDSEQSGCASALSISQPLYTRKSESGFIAVNGSPADCVYLALHQLYSDINFDCVITGINSGANLGQDVLFSGTFGAALTAQLFGIPAIATSLVGGAIRGDGQDNTSQYQMAAEEIVKLLTETPLLEEMRRLPYHVLNVNIPEVHSAKDIKGRKITCLSHSLLAKPVHHVVDPRGRDAYWLSLRKGVSSSLLNKGLVLDNALNNEMLDKETETATGQPVKPADNNEPLSYVTDEEAVAAGYISLSPVRLHHTPASTLDQLSALAL
ncbi:5'/3'-nucleotidase SurE [Psychrobacter frigidicola]|uniref:5'-nucleotidase SurE n=1 Tax=Psychrobacter frigidicola TaxID=45611 RepID=A0A5C7A526_9GAMM|nr:5'/3'-nucleotidase SurE [Psychrobacter frigidicola]TXD97684.1 5'/3'-nucleotidase SurE [Psychrobacter frigidicola]